MRGWLLSILLLSSYCMAFDVEQATKPPPPPVEKAPEKAKFEFQSREDVLSAVSSGEARIFFDDSLGRGGEPAVKMNYAAWRNIEDVAYERNLRNVLVNSYGMDASVKEFQDACQNIEHYHFKRPFFSNFKLLGQSTAYSKRHTLNDVQGYAESFTGEYQDEAERRAAFSTHFNEIVKGCAGSEFSESLLNAYKAYVQDVGSAMEAYVAPKREALKAQIPEYLAMMKRIANPENTPQNQCRQTPAFRLFFEARTIEVGGTTLASLRRQMQREDAITKESGVVNTTKKYNLGKAIKETEMMRKSAFADYKRLGGKETSMEKVKAPQNPCP